jgi:hypothetical protein
MRKQLIKQLAVTGLAVAAVAGVAVAASAAANNRQDTPAASAAGGPDPAVPGSTPGNTTQGSTPGDSARGNVTPGPTPGNATPGERASGPATPAPPRMTPGSKVMPGKGIPPQPGEQPLPADAVKACRELVAEAGQPGRGAKVVARVDGEPGTVLVLADGKYWAGCSTAYARQNGRGSLRQPARIAKPSDADAFAVANNIFPLKGKEYEYYWAAGLLPAGVAKVAYTFPDGVTTSAVVQGDYWLMQHRESKPWVQGADADRPKIKVVLSRADGSAVKTFRLTWGEQTCAQITHGC